MRGSAASMRLLRARTADDALRLLARHPEALPLAGGTDLMVAWNEGHLNGRTVLDLSQVAAWRRVRVGARGASLGALVTHRQVQRHDALRGAFPLLAQGCATVGGVQIQNRGTLAGNVANASPAGDTFPPLAVYDAVVRVRSADGRRAVPIHDVFAGVKKTVLAPGELIAGIELPRLPTRPARQMFRKVGTRAAQAISKTVAAGLLWKRRDGRIRELRFALGSMAPTVRRLRAVEAYVVDRKPTRTVLDRAAELLREDVDPIDDLRSTREYRMLVSQNLLRDFLSS